MQRVVSTTAAYTLEDQERMRAAKRYFEWQSQLARPQLGRRVLEIGCGVGNFTRTITDRELVIATDVEAGCVAALRVNLADSDNVATDQVDAADPEFRRLARYRPDSIVCLNVLEHIADDRAALSNMHAVLPPGGRVVLIVPAFECLYGPIDVKLGHYRRYTKAGLAVLARQVGFSIRIARYMNFVGFWGWWLNAKVFKRTEQSLRQIQFFDRFIVPVQATAERWAPPPCGQSVFAVLAKD